MRHAQHALVLLLQTANPANSMRLSMVAAALATVDTSLIIQLHLAYHVTQPALLAANLHPNALPANQMHRLCLRLQTANATMDTSGIVHFPFAPNAMPNARLVLNPPRTVSAAELTQLYSPITIPASVSQEHTEIFSMDLNASNAHRHAKLVLLLINAIPALIMLLSCLETASAQSTATITSIHLLTQLNLAILSARTAVDRCEQTASIAMISLT